MGNQAGIRKLAIGTLIDSNQIDPGINNEFTAQIHGVSFSSKKTITTAKDRPNLLVEVKTETYYELGTMAKKCKFRGRCLTTNIKRQEHE